MLPDEIALPPYQGHTVQVSVINGSRSYMPAGMLVDPPLAGQKYIHLSCYSFLIESTHRGQKILFDLAFMKDHAARMTPALQAMFADVPDLGGMDAVHDVPDTLIAHNIDLATISAIVWSHTHLDHIGDPAVFPSSTDLVVGPGVKAQYMPGYPTDPNGLVHASAFAGRHVRELRFDDSTSSSPSSPSSSSPLCTIAGFPALDFFGDASFFLLHAPGHTSHHLMALCRTTPDSWLLMAGDAAHHVGQLRPNAFLPLPANLPAAMLGRVPPPETCSCAHVARTLKARQRQTAAANGASEQATGTDAGNTALFGLAAGMHEEVEKSEQTVSRLKAFDAREDVMVLLAHDLSMTTVLDFFPATINDWKARGWAEAGRWLFLKDLEAYTAS